MVAEAYPETIPNDLQARQAISALVKPNYAALFVIAAAEPRAFHSVLEMGGEYGQPFINGNPPRQMDRFEAAGLIEKRDDEAYQVSDRRLAYHKALARLVIDAQLLCPISFMELFGPSEVDTERDPSSTTLGIMTYKMILDGPPEGVLVSNLVDTVPSLRLIQLKRYVKQGVLVADGEVRQRTRLKQRHVKLAVSSEPIYKPEAKAIADAVGGLMKRGFETVSAQTVVDMVIAANPTFKENALYSMINKGLSFARKIEGTEPGEPHCLVAEELKPSIAALVHGVQLLQTDNSYRDEMAAQADSVTPDVLQKLQEKLYGIEPAKPKPPRRRTRYLLPPIGPTYYSDWRNRANCKGRAEVFEADNLKSKDTQEAIRICKGCTEGPPCLSEALKNNECDTRAGLTRAQRGRLPPEEQAPYLSLPIIDARL